jgi:hypothetical protein
MDAVENMDIIALIENGIATALISALLVSIGFYLLRNRVKAYIWGEVTGFIAFQMNDIQAHPEKIQPFIDSIIGMIGTGTAKAVKETIVKLPFGIKLPASMLQPLIEPLLKKFAGNMASETAKKATEGAFG